MTQAHETLNSLQEQLREIDDERAALVSKKKDVEALQSDINGEIRGNHNIPSHRWKTLLRDQTRYKRQQSDMDAKLGELSTRKRKINSLIDAIKRESNFKAVSRAERQNSIRAKMVALKEKYAEFSADASRVSSMRRMAAEFSIEIDRLLVEDATSLAE